MRTRARSRSPRHVDGSRLQQLAAAVSSIGLYSWIEADYYSVDGATGKVAAFLDKVAPGTGIKAITPTHALAQATSARQVALPAADALLGGALAAPFVGGQVYVSNSTVTAWKPLHQASREVFYVHRPTSLVNTQIYWATGTSTQSSSYMYGTATTGAGKDITFKLGGGTVIEAIYTSQLAPERLEGRHDAGTGKTVYRNGVLAGSGTAGTSYDTGDAGSTLTLGAQLAPSFLFPSTLSWGAFLCSNRVLTAGERLTINTYLTAKYGV